MAPVLLPVFTQDLRLFGPSRFFPVLWPLLTSYGKLYSAGSDFFPYFCVRKTSPGKSNNLPPIYLPHLQCKVRAVLDFVLYRRLVRFALPHMRFLFVRPGVCPCRHFAASTSGFLQIPPHDGHPCLRLTVPTAKSVVDFHHQVIALAGRTTKKHGPVAK